MCTGHSHEVVQRQKISELLLSDLYNLVFLLPELEFFPVTLAVFILPEVEFFPVSLTEISVFDFFYVLFI